MSVLLAARAGVAALPASARSRGDGHGSAIVPIFSVEHDALLPGDDAVLGACVTNGNADARAELRAGDAFHFDFAEGVVGGCMDVTVSSRDGSLAPADFACETSADTVTLTCVGTGGPWRRGDLACAMFGYQSGTQSGAVLLSHEVGEGVASSRRSRRRSW
jgi:hypothetical protein